MCLAASRLVPLLLLLTPLGAIAEDLLRYTIRFEPFEVELTLPDGRTQKRSLPRQPTYFLHRVNNRWPVPDGPADQKVRCEIRWVGLPADWRLVTSFGIDKRVEQVETTLGKLRKVVVAGGDFRTAQSKGGLVLVTRGSLKIADAEVLTLMDQIAATETAVWGDRGVTGHRFFVLPTEGSWRGEGRTNGLVMEGSPESYEFPHFARLMAHELFHEWNPRRVNFPDDEELYWFTEGFTEYYTMLTVWRAGIVSFEEALTHFNRIARSYYASQARNFSPDRMVKMRQSNSAATRLPYEQGFLLAAHWNQSGKSLDAAMRNLINDNGAPLSNARIAKALRSIGIVKPEEAIQRYIVEGKTIELRRSLWGTCATETSLPVRGFDMGFDSGETKTSDTVQGTRPDSNAWRAGIRDGQKWQALDIVWGDPTYLAEIEIEDAQGQRRVKYYPASTATSLAPQYKANTARCDTNRLRPLSAKN